MPDAIIIGGGIIGSSVAYHLVKRNVETLLIDRHHAGRATDAGAGIISPVTSSRSDSDIWFDLANEAARYYPTLIDQIEDETGLEAGFDRCGLLTVAVDLDEVESIEETALRIDRRREKTDIAIGASPIEIPGSSAKERFPPLASVRRALYIEDAGRVNGGQLTRVLRTAAETAGLESIDESAREIETEAGRVVGVRTDSHTFEAPTVVLAGGAWSPSFEKDLDIKLPVAPQRGQIAHLRLPNGDPNSKDWPVVKAHRGHYLVPWPDGRIVAGATREDGTGFDARTTVGGIAEVLTEALRTAPGLNSATIEELRVGLRPVSRDQLPLIGPASRTKGVYLATGHGATGLQLGPYTGRILAEIIDEGTSPVDMSRFDPMRFTD